MQDSKNGNNDNGIVWLVILSMVIGAIIPGLIAQDLNDELQQQRATNQNQAREIDLLKAKIEGMLINE